MLYVILPACLFMLSVIRVSRVGFRPLQDLQNAVRGWRAAWMTFNRAYTEFKREWHNQWPEQWRKAGL